ncbi:MAG: LCP family protein [Candidatus Nanopelagicales bacterium]
MWGLLAVVGLGLVVWILLTNLSGDPADPAAPTPTPSTAAEQQTLLIQVRNDADLGAGNLIAGVGGDLPPAQLLAASRLIVDVPGAGQQTLGQSARMLDRSASQDSLSDLLALRIDGTLSLGRLALAGMVDFVGGITVDVDQEITSTDPDSGVQTVVVPAGTQTLDGTQAAAYALAWLPDEPEAARMARYSQVMTATISGLPDDALRIESMLTSLGGSARTTAPTTTVAEFLLALRGAILAGGQQVRVLPTTDIEAGEELSVVRVDLDAADAVTAALFGPSVLTGVESNPRVLVRNGVGTPGLGASARDRLVAAGMVYVNGGNADEFGQVTTQVIVADSTMASLALGEQVVSALEVQDAVVQVADSGQNVADVVVVLGADFEP